MADRRGGHEGVIPAILLLALLGAVAAVPSSLRAHAARRDAFLGSFGPVVESVHPEPAVPRSPRIQRRRRIAGGLLSAMAATLVVGLLPDFRALLVVHLFLVDSFLAYVAILAHKANRTAGLVTPP